jgi:DNA-binding beta-propeller fold protein YncE
MRGARDVAKRTGSVLATVDVGRHPEWFAVGDGLWVTATTDQTLVGLDPATATVTATVPVASGNRPADPSVAGGLVWVANRVDGTLRAVDPVSASVVRVLQLPAAGAGVVEGHDRLLFVTDFAGASAWVLSLP